MAEPDRGVVAAISKTGFGRGGIRRQLRDRPGEEGRHSPVESQSEGVGVGTGTQTAEASEAHFCIQYLRNGALGTSVNRTLGVNRELTIPSDLRTSAGDDRAYR